MRVVFVSMLVCGALTSQAVDHTSQSLRLGKDQTTTNLLCAGKRGGMMDLNVDFVVKADGKMGATVFPNRGQDFHYSTVFNAEELEYFRVVLRYARIAERPEGGRGSADGGNWELTVNYNGKSNHVFLSSFDFDRERPLACLYMFLLQLTWQPEEARRISRGLSDARLEKSLQFYILRPNSRGKDIDAVKRKARTAEDWKSAKSLLQELTPVLTHPEWCGLVALYLKEAEEQQRSSALAEIWKSSKVVWHELPRANAWWLTPVMEAASLGDANKKARKEP